MFDRINFRKQKPILSVEQFAARSGLNVRTFFTKKPSVANQTHFRIYKHVRKSKNISLSDRKLFQFQQTTPLERTLATFGTIHTVKVNNIHACCVAEIFPPYTLYTQTRGRPFLRRLCAQ